MSHQNGAGVSLHSCECWLLLVLIKISCIDVQIGCLNLKYSALAVAQFHLISLGADLM